jgi:hypothetical protein
MKRKTLKEAINLFLTIFIIYSLHYYGKNVYNNLLDCPEVYKHLFFARTFFYNNATRYILN